MTQQDKDLLLHDLCARLPYGVKVKIGHESPIVQIVETVGKSVSGKDSVNGWDFDEVEIKPYLRHVSDMTDKEWNEFMKLYDFRIDDRKIYITISKFMDYLNAHNFDLSWADKERSC